MNLYSVAVILVALSLVNCDSNVKKKKNIQDFDDADIERLYQEWEENDDEKLPVDELPEYMRPKEKGNIKLDDIKNKNIDEVMKLTKKGKPVMIFVTVSGKPNRSETEEITTFWQTSLFNANYEIQRFMESDNRAIFMIKDGSLAWEIKDFLIKQDRCEDVTIDNQVFNGKAKTSKMKKDL